MVSLLLHLGILPSFIHVVIITVMSCIIIAELTVGQKQSSAKKSEGAKVSSEWQSFSSSGGSSAQKKTSGSNQSYSYPPAATTSAEMTG